MKVLSLFDGISCARVALERAGIAVTKYYASEVDKYAIQIALKNYPDTVQVGSVTELDGNYFQGINLLIGGSPCQDLSIAKKERKGLDGERSSLFWEYVRILKESNPKYFILENVNSMPKEAKAIITETLGVEPIMINAALVSAQNRKRLFWTNIPNVTLPEDLNIYLKDILEDFVAENLFCKNSPELLGNVNLSGRGMNGCVYGVNAKSPTLTTNKGEGTKIGVAKIGHLNKGGQGDRIYSVDGKSVCLSANGGGRGAKTGLYLMPCALTESRTEEAKRIRSENLKEGKDYSPRRAKELTPRTDGKSNCITTSQTKESLIVIPDKSKTIRTSGRGSGYGDRHNWDMISHIRKLTPIECERLQGLPDDHTSGISNTQRYKCLGNAFNVDVIAHVLSFIPKD